MTYVVVSARGERQLAEAVNAKLADGWQLQGGVAAMEYAGSICLYQALVK